MVGFLPPLFLKGGDFLTHKEMSCFTNRQLRQFSHEELNALPIQELIDLSKVKCDFAEVVLSSETETPKTNVLSWVKRFLYDSAVQVAANVAESSLKSLLCAIVELLQKITGS